MPSAGDAPGQAPLELVRVGRGRDLLVADRYVLPRSSLELRLEQLALVRVERLVFALAPPVGKARGDLAGKEPAEERVARVRRRRRQHREVVRRLDVEQRREQRLEHAPLVEAQAVDDDEHRGAARARESAAGTRRRRRSTAADDPPRGPRATRGYARRHVRRELALHVRDTCPASDSWSPISPTCGELDVPIAPARRSARSTRANRVAWSRSFWSARKRSTNWRATPAGGCCGPSRMRVTTVSTCRGLIGLTR